MVQLFLNNTEVVPDAGTTIKVTKENPYFTLSDSYTLEVSVPLDIYENKKFFGEINRPEKQKEYKEYEARLDVDNKQILKGKARITQSNNKEVKLQLTTGISSLKMTAANENLYIDEMDLGKFSGLNIFPHDIDSGTYRTSVSIIPDLQNLISVGGWGIPLHDETNDINANVCSNATYFLTAEPDVYHRFVAVCPNLLEVAQAIAYSLGYFLNYGNLPEACRHIYIVTGIQDDSVARKLPHWTVAEFFDQLQNFFGCTIEDSGNNGLRMIQLNSYARRGIIEITPTEEFEVDYMEDDDAKGVMNSNLEFSMSGSGAEVVDEDILQYAEQVIKFDNFAAAENNFKKSTDKGKMRNIYDVHGELYIGWEDENSVSLKRIAPFNKLTRYKDAEYTTLKISPVPMAEGVECEFVHSSVFSSYAPKLSFKANLPSVTNNFGIKERVQWNINNEEQEEKATLQALVEGDEQVSGSIQKDDQITVAFMDGNAEEVTAEGTDKLGKDSMTLKAHFAFTDARFMHQFKNTRKNWSLSLKEVKDFDFYLGQLHKLEWECSRKCKYKATFLADEIPDPKSIMLIRNKKYACEKIEADIKDGKLSRLMTGYFYEMKENDAHE